MSKDQSPVPILAISLLQRTDRRRAMRASLSDQVNFIEAVDGRFLKKHPTLTRGELGCFESHVKAWNAIATGEHELVLVLEDDAVISIPTIRKAVHMMSSMSFTAFVLGVNAPFTSTSVSDGVVRPHTSLFGMHAVLYTRDGARRLLQAVNREGLYVPSDTFLARQPGVFVAQPSLVLPANIKDSDTQNIR